MSEELESAHAATLDRLEWKHVPFDQTGDRCRMCGRTRIQGHAEGCGFVALRQAVEGRSIILPASATVAAIRARLSEIPDGPWHAGRTVGRTVYRGDGPDDLIGVMDSRALGAFVAHARTDIPFLLATLERAGERIAGLEAALEMADDVLVEFVNLRIPDTAISLGWSHPYEYDGQLVVRAERAIVRSRAVSEALAAEGGGEKE